MFHTPCQNDRRFRSRQSDNDRSRLACGVRKMIAGAGSSVERPLNDLRGGQVSFLRGPFEAWPFRECKIPEHDDVRGRDDHKEAQRGSNLFIFDKLPKKVIFLS